MMDRPFGLDSHGITMSTVCSTSGSGLANATLQWIRIVVLMRDAFA